MVYRLLGSTVIAAEAAASVTRRTRVAPSDGVSVERGCRGSIRRPESYRPKLGSPATPR
ncbi:MAG: hypothetical protein ABI065_10235 [Terrimesophilobacter sp.]